MKQYISLFFRMILAVPFFMSACSIGSSDTKVITVASKDFTEQFILGEIYAQLLEEEGFQVERKLDLGGTPVAHEAITNGEIDLYPEYTGTGLLTILKLPASSDREEVFHTVASGYEERFELIWLEPAPMNNTQALAMTQAGAQEFGIRTISDMVVHAEELVMVGPPEFREREDGLPGLKEIYGDFELKDYRDVDPGLRYQVLTSGQADVTVAFGTDGEISAYDLVVLEDDRNMFPPYQVAPVVRREVLNRYPEIEEILNRVAPLLTDEVMREMNFEVSGNQREPEDVARDFLVENNLTGK
ncbi:MAG: quaternary ammonium transporter [Chloroflexi bacterium]|nr:MAG: quaternary ammonium transporter [Chloroflexota bacterium]